MATLMLDEGTATTLYRRSTALRMRVRRSAIGSDMLMASLRSRLSLPARLGYAGDETLERHLTEADAAQPELADEAARSAAAHAAVTHPVGVLPPRLANNHACLC